MSKIAKILDREETRQSSYLLLSKSYSMPEKNMLKQLTDLETIVARVYSKAAVHALNMGKEIEKMEIIDPLKVDYSKLFVGPFGLLAPPYGSIYLEKNKKIMGDSTVNVQNRYKEVGVDISVNFKEPPDHIIAELEFVHYLIKKEIEAIIKGEFNKAVNYLHKQKEFLNSHLGVWIFEFANNIESKAETEFYKQLALFTKTFITKDRDEILEDSILELSRIA
jgi:TorA maturation chaperone TorD